MRKQPQDPESDETAKAKQRIAKIRRLLDTEDGAALMEELSIQFDGSMVRRDANGAVDPYQTAINVGAREVVVFLRDIGSGKEGVNP